MTEQCPDLIVFEGKSYQLFSIPLLGYLEKRGLTYPKSALDHHLYRGYVAGWEIKNGCLYFREIAYPKGLAVSSRLTADMVREPGEDLYLADWYTGKLVIPYGEKLVASTLAFCSLYQHYHLLSVDQGEVTEKRNLTGQEYDRLFGLGFLEPKKGRPWWCSWKREEGKVVGWYIPTGRWVYSR